MNKNKLIEVILEMLKSDLELAQSVAQMALQDATNEENQPENEYDTRALEASYLAGAQSKRVLDIEEQINFYKSVQVRNFKSSDKISALALVVVSHNGKKMYLFLSAKGGGKSIHFNDQEIQIISLNSPLGEALLGLQIGDEALIEVGDKEHIYEIISLY